MERFAGAVPGWPEAQKHLARAMLARAQAKADNLTAEVIETAGEDDAVGMEIGFVTKRVGKVPILCKDTKGFVVNRLLRRCLLPPPPQPPL
jgi:3-hydroxyacyl-CoA dehydrogenase